MTTLIGSTKSNSRSDSRKKAILQRLRRKRSADLVLFVAKVVSDLEATGQESSVPGFTNAFYDPVGLKDTTYDS